MPKSNLSHKDRQPTSTRPHLPASYGIDSNSSEGILPWSFIDERMANSRNYWIATVTPGGRPHVMPVWGIWLSGLFYFATDPISKKARNIASNPEIAVHLESGDEVVILEGTAEEIIEDSEITRFVDAYDVKYGFRPETNGKDIIVYKLCIRLALAWEESDFPKTATRWVAED